MAKSGVSAPRCLELPRTPARLLRLNAGCVNDLSPFVEIVADDLCKLRGARSGCIDSSVGQLHFDVHFDRHFRACLVETLNNGGIHCGWPQQPIPSRVDVVGKTGLSHGRDTVSYTHLRAHETVLDLVC